MKKYRLRTLFNNNQTVETITFDELVQNGRENGKNIVNGMPWSWNYFGNPISHENDECYLIGAKGEKMTPQDLLIKTEKDELYVLPKELFTMFNEEVNE